MTSDILRYVSRLHESRLRFLLEYKAEWESFETADRILGRLPAIVQPLPAPGRKEPLSVTPFLLVMQRRARDAFDGFCAYQSALAWGAMRPFAEAPLILGKWLDDPRNAILWLERNSGKTARREYQEAYGGDRQKPNALPHADALRNLWVRLGDDFLAANPRFYAHPVPFSVESGRATHRPEDLTDHPDDHRAHLYAWLHVVWLVLHAAGQMLAQRFGERPDLRVDLVGFQRQFAPRVVPVARSHEAHHHALVHLGLWPHDLLR